MSRILYTAGVGEWKTALSRKAVVLRALGTILCSMIGCAAMAQPIYFDELFDESFLTESLRNVVAHEEGYLFNIRSRDVFADTALMALILVDDEGVEIRRTIYNPGGRTQNFGTLITHSDSGHVFFNSVGDTIDNSRDFQLIRYDDEGEVVYTREYVRDGNDICFWGIQCSEGGFALCGQGGSFNGVLPETMLIRTDSIGNELWRQFYGGSSYEGGADIVETPDGGFLLLGWTRSFGAGQRDFYLVKTNALGNEQ